MWRRKDEEKVKENGGGRWKEVEEDCNEGKKGRKKDDKGE